MTRQDAYNQIAHLHVNLKPSFKQFSPGLMTNCTHKRRLDCSQFFVVTRIFPMDEKNLFKEEEFHVILLTK